MSDLITQLAPFIQALPTILRKVNLVVEGQDPEEVKFTQEVHGTDKEAKQAAEKLYRTAKRMVWLKSNGKSIFIATALIILFIVSIYLLFEYQLNQFKEYLKSVGVPKENLREIYSTWFFTIIWDSVKGFWNSLW